MAGRTARLARSALRSGVGSMPMIELRARSVTDISMSAGTSGTIPFDTLDSDAFSGMYRASDNATFPVPRSGRAQIRFVGQISNDGVYIAVQKLDTANTATELTREGPTAAGGPVDVDFSFVTYVRAGDRLQAIYDNTAGGSRTISAVAGKGPRLEIRIESEVGSLAN